MYSVLYSEIDMEGDIYEIEQSAEKSRKNEVKEELGVQREAGGY